MARSRRQRVSQQIMCQPLCTRADTQLWNARETVQRRRSLSPCNADGATVQQEGCVHQCSRSSWHCDTSSPSPKISSCISVGMSLPVVRVKCLMNADAKCVYEESVRTS